MSEEINKKEKELNSSFTEKYRSDTDFTNNLNRDESMIYLDSQMSYPTNSINNITSYYRNSDTNKQQDQLDVSSQMNELIENNTLNIIALQKVLNCLVINLGKNLLDAKDLKRSFRNSEKKSSHNKDYLDNDNDQDNLSRQSDDNDSLGLDRLEEDEVKPLKIVKNQRLNKNSEANKSKGRNTKEINEEENDDNFVDPSFGITVNSKGFANVKEEKTSHKRSNELNTIRSSKYDITQNSKSREQKDSLESSMKRDNKKENKSNNDKLNYDPMFQEKIKSEIMTEIKKQVDRVSGSDHSSIQIQQVQKIPDNTSNETIKEELTELQQLFSKIVDKDKDIEKILNDIQGRTNKAAMDINNIKTDFHKCASKDDLSNITSIIPNLSTKEDVEMVVEKLKDKLDLNEFNTVKIQINKLEQNQTMQVQNHSQEERIAGIEDSINSVRNAKVDAKFVLEKTQDVRQEFIEKFTDYNDFKESQKERLDNIQKNFTKLEKSIENKAHKDQIWELKEKFQEFATKQTLTDLEDKVFPIMTEVVDRIRSFQKHIDESSRQMVRFDEVIVDKASKHDLAKINKKLENTLEIDRFEELKKEFDTQSKSSSLKIESQDTSIENIKLIIDEIKVKAEETTNSVTALTEINMDYLKKDDLNLVWERLDTKSDKLDLLKIYDLKSNKSDINMLLKCIDSVQMNVKQLSNISVNTMRVINYSLMDEDLVKTDKNRQIVLQNLQNFQKQMVDQRIGDVAVGNINENTNNNENQGDKIKQGVIDVEDDINDRDKNTHFNFKNTNSSDKRIDSKILRQSLNMTPIRGIGSKYRDESRESRNQKSNRNLSNSKSFVLPNIHK